MYGRLKRQELQPPRFMPGAKNSSWGIKEVSQRQRLMVEAWSHLACDLVPGRRDTAGPLGVSPLTQKLENLAQSIEY